MRKEKTKYSLLILAGFAATLAVGSAYSDEEDTRNVLKQGLLGAGVGAISAEASGGKAGQGALVGAGTAVIGSALLDALTGPSSRSGGTRRRGSAAPPPDDYYYSDEPEEYYVEEAPPQESGSQKIIKQGLVGAGTGAIAAGVSGGNAGKGALIGAGTSVIGNALLDTITEPPQTRRGRVYRKVRPAPQPQQMPQPQPTQRTYSQESTETTPDGTRKRVIKKYDESGKLVSEEEIYY